MNYSLNIIGDTIILTDNNKNVISMYNKEMIKSIAGTIKNDGNAYIQLYFSSDSNDNPLLLSLVGLQSPSFSNDVFGLSQALSYFSDFLNKSVSMAPIINRVVDSSYLLELECYSVSVANVGAVDGFVNGVTLKAGETFNFDAGGDNNYFPASSFGVDAIGTEIVIIAVIKL